MDKEIGTSADGPGGCLSKGNTSNHWCHLSIMIDFLEKAYETGSMAKATKAVGISYAKGRKMLGTLNNLANRKLVITHAGGTNGGETRLALEGKVFLEVVSENETVVFAPNHL